MTIERLHFSLPEKITIAWLVDRYKAFYVTYGKAPKRVILPVDKFMEMLAEGIIEQDIDNPRVKDDPWTIMGMRWFPVAMAVDKITFEWENDIPGDKVKHNFETRREQPAGGFSSAAGLFIEWDPLVKKGDKPPKLPTRDIIRVLETVCSRLKYLEKFSPENNEILHPMEHVREALALLDKNGIEYEA